MVNKRNTLGRGLGSLLNVSEKKVEESIFDEIQINKIEINKDQPRKSFNEQKIKELSLSIKQHGIIQPITVRRIDNDKFQLISGERRFRASKLIGIKTIPAFIRDTDDNNLLELALIENIQRENLNSIEIAISYKKLIDELSINQEKLGARVGKDRTTINNYLRLLKLPPTIQKGLKDNKIQMGHARSLIAIETSELQLKIYQLILVNKLSVRKTEELVRNLNKQKRSIPKEKSRTNNLEKIESKLSSYFGTKITTQGDDKSGKIIIPYKSTNDLNRILELLDII
ncbi:MAG: ParB/RepB/Spo0J family partition protein [Cytophagales bacterium]